MVTVKCYLLNKISTPLHAFITVYLCLYQVHVIPRHVSVFSSYVYLQLVLCFGCYDNSCCYLQVHRISRVRTSFSTVSPLSHSKTIPEQPQALVLKWGCVQSLWPMKFKIIFSSLARRNHFDNKGVEITPFWKWWGQPSPVPNKVCDWLGKQ